MQAGLNAFTMSPTKWISGVNANSCNRFNLQDL